jgi:hypothetical protein
LKSWLLRGSFNGRVKALRSRWIILAVLLAVRLIMGFQFQRDAAIAPLLGRDLGVGLADTGILIGLYFRPGVALALPGGAIGQRFGDKRTVLGDLMLMPSHSLQSHSGDEAEVGVIRTYSLTTH